MKPPIDNLSRKIDTSTGHGSVKEGWYYEDYNGLRMYVMLPTGPICIGVIPWRNIKHAAARKLASEAPA